MPYLGNSPANNVRGRFYYTASAAQTLFSGADSNGKTLAYQDGGYVDVYLNGVLLQDTIDYTATTKTSINLVSGATAGDLVEIIAYGIFSVADTVSALSGGTFDGAVVVNNNFTVDNGTIKLDGNYPVGTNNVALGDTALDSMVSGSRNTALGFSAGTALSTQNYNVFVGSYSGDGATGSSNVAVGDVTLRNASGNYNVALGGEALTSITSASNLTAVGYQAGYSNTTGDRIVAVGEGSLYSNTTGAVNVALGSKTLRFNTTGANNVAIGHEALYNNTTASNNVAVGFEAGYSNTTSTFNTTVGTLAGYSGTGGYNTFLGYGAGYHVSTGIKNTLVGMYNGNQGGLDIRTSSNNIVLADGDGNPRLYVNSSGQFSLGDSVAIGGGGYGATQFTLNADNGDYNSAFHSDSSSAPFGIFIKYTGAAPNGTGNAFITCADTSASRMLVYSNGNIVNQNNSYGAISDASLKENIIDATSQWDDIKAIQVRKYSYISDNLDTPNHIGVVAQELEAAGMNGLVEEAADKETGDITKQVKYSVLYMKAVKALQEAMERIETLEAKVAALEAN